MTLYNINSSKVASLRSCSLKVPYRNWLYGTVWYPQNILLKLHHFGNELENNMLESHGCSSLPLTPCLWHYLVSDIKMPEICSLHMVIWPFLCIQYRYELLSLPPQLKLFGPCSKTTAGLRASIIECN